ncbi:MAG: ATP-binding protein, partial [Pseudomonadota bacterium]|nr:ATP-binding protein [Pseudomonadota bacterium]
MQRRYIIQLEYWKASEGRKPLLLLGARQVGKTHLLESFGAHSFKHVILLNFEENKEIHSFFDSNISPDTIIRSIEVYFGNKIDPTNTLIIFDEVQECPRALTSLKYFCEKAPEYFIAAAGSLLGLKMGKRKLAEKSGFPVGKVQLLTIYPMSFFEFLQAIDKAVLANYLRDINEVQPLPEALHNQALELTRLYTFIGGMPEAVKMYRDTQDLTKVREVHKQIIKTYELDFSKHSEGALISKLSAVWDVLASQLARENKKFIFTAIRQSARAREYEEAIQWLIDAALIYRTRQLKTPKLPLKAYTDDHAFKLYVIDVGILGALSQLPAQVILKDNEIFSEFMGALTENLVLQQLKIAGQEDVYYWTSGNTAEVDFVVSIEGEIVPVEVKTGTSKKKKSLKVYQDKYQPTISVRVSPRNFKKDGQLINYPFY